MLKHFAAFAIVSVALAACSTQSPSDQNLSKVQQDCQEQRVRDDKGNAIRVCQARSDRGGSQTYWHYKTNIVCGGQVISTFWAVTNETCTSGSR